GRFKGRRLPSPRSDDVRPTTDRVREAVFSSIGPLVHDAHVLELFAGTGAFGFEAMSRGAHSVVFVEKDRTTAGVLAQTARALNVGKDVVILNRPARQAVSWLAGQGRKFHIIFLDPPYGEDRVRRLLHDPDFLSLVAAHGVVITEQDANIHDSTYPGQLCKKFERRYGGTLIEMLYSVPEDG
ncbi:MAG: 16S rRNA (guanine(966)-N(2))-methyltransferase RsmD, partial [Desulfomonilaceae bacterium]|nr:16S rRNA (guanine(966)-N(2))-methyltransferase RsmD [Desulfomonilaceae bacterium]